MIQWLNSTTMRFLSLLEWFAVTHNSQKVSAEFSVIVLKGRWNNLKAELQNDGDCNMLLTCCGATYFSVIRAPQTSLCFSVLHWYHTAPCSSTDTELVFAGLLSSYPDKMCWLKKVYQTLSFSLILTKGIIKMHITIWIETDLFLVCITCQRTAGL